MTGFAIFDADGVCLRVDEGKVPLPALGYPVPEGMRPAELWLDGGKVRRSKPTTLVLPGAVPIGEALERALPKGAVADVDGVRQRGRLIVPTHAAGTVYIEVRGAESGSFVIEVQDYAAARRSAYPSLADQLDALWKGGNEADAMRASIAAVKAAHPKPKGT